MNAHTSSVSLKFNLTLANTQDILQCNITNKENGYKISSSSYRPRMEQGVLKESEISYTDAEVILTHQRTCKGPLQIIQENALYQNSRKGNSSCSGYSNQTQQLHGTSANKEEKVLFIPDNGEERQKKLWKKRRL
ncbi:hypothetical protein CEXT_610821 [Caerostris extrusa]|uniref:Uncharacterized protein n=1 Tax=Caerostris extrusa TaxID=172846 RepID=A0AAV4QZV9_CAEEX|nr:hypothetical protein CEXT_610821 [Caerostris extrusa]